jgi:2-polyprenyl-6-methoxyphenol hydroxylase-like FAD-dependent oxidoreductase
VRKQLPTSVEFIVGRVADVTACPDRQRVVLGSGDLIEARLIVLASGLGDVLRQKLGIQRHIRRSGHSLSIGFSIVPESERAFGFSALTYYGERITDRIGYISLFPIGSALRANLFCYRGHDGDWARRFRESPHEALYGVLPGLEPFLGNFKIVSKVKMRMVDLVEVQNHRRDGAVLIGDAFQTTCPAAGNGVTRVLIDVDRLCNHYVPKWFATPGMSAQKISQFYDDEVKQEYDSRASYEAEYCRAFAIDAGIAWRARRWKAYVRPRLRNLAGSVADGLSHLREISSQSRPEQGANSKTVS